MLIDISHTLNSNTNVHGVDFSSESIDLLTKILIILFDFFCFFTNVLILSETNADIFVTFICTQFNDILNMLIREHLNKALEASSFPSKYSNFSSSS